MVLEDSSRNHPAGMGPTKACITRGWKAEPSDGHARDNGSKMRLLCAESQVDDSSSRKQRALAVGS